MTEEALDLATRWMDRGAKLLPLGANKAPVGHLVPGGFKDATSSPSKLWWFEHDDTRLVGLVPGSIGAIVLDVDVKSADNGDENLKALEAKQSGAVKGVLIATPSGGYHIYLRKPVMDEHIGNRDLCKGVNVRCDGGYVVAPGNPGYGRIEADSWRRPTYLPPDWVMRILREPVAEAADYDEVDAHRESEWHPRVQAKFEEYTGEGDRHTSMATIVNALASYELLGFAGSTSSVEELREIFIESVADRSSAYVAGQEYDRALDGARKRVREHKSTVLEERDLDAAFIEQIIKENGGDDADVAKAYERVAERSKLRMWSMNELMQADLTVHWLVRNVLITPTYGQIAGESKTLKTLLSQFLALAVASGRPFLGRFPVERTGPVVVFVGEGGRIPWTRRLPRIARAAGVADITNLPIHACFDTAPLLSDRFRNTVHDILEDVKPVLTILDPFYAFHGTEVNSASLHEEGALLTATAEPFIEQQTTLLIVNHMNKQQGGRSLKRITMAGSGEWVDSWIMTAEREPPQLDTGDFSITAEFGSRQWGGSRWDMDINIGNPDSDGLGASDAPITLNVRKNFD